MSNTRRSGAPPSDVAPTTLGQPIALGRTAEVFALDDGRVLKLLLPDFPDEIAVQEAEVEAVITRVFPGAPRLDGLVTANGRLGLVLERIDGPTMDAFVRSHLTQANRLGRTLGELHATMHGADGKGLVDQLDAFRSAIDGAAAELPSGARDAALRRLEQLPRGSSLCHGDLHPGNVILASGRAVVIDWGNAHRGNPAADVARSSYLMLDTPMHESRPLGPFVRALRRWFHAGYLARYRELRPLEASELLAWRLPILAARMAEGIDDERASLRAAIAGELRG